MIPISPAPRPWKISLNQRPLLAAPGLDFETGETSNPNHPALRSKPLALFIAIVLLLLALPAPAQTPQFRIAGTIVNANTNAPLRRATITAHTVEGHLPVASAESDSDGHFVLDHLPAAKYDLFASRRGFLSAAYDQHGQFSTAIVTGSDQQTENLVFRLIPSALLRGSVTADGGDPVDQAQVMLFRKPSGEAPGERISEAGATQTDDTGAYEFSNLQPGDYLIAVQAEPWYALHRFNPQSRQREPNDPSAALDAAFPITFYESTTDEASAASITLTGGNSAVANIALQAVPALHLRVDAITELMSPSDSDQSEKIPHDLRPSLDLRQTLFGTKALNVELQNTGPDKNDLEFNGIAPGKYQLAQGDYLLDLDASNSQHIDPTQGTPTVALKGALRPYSASDPPGNIFVTLEPTDHHQNPITVQCSDLAFQLATVPPGNWNLWVDSETGPLAVTRIAANNHWRDGNEINVRERSLTLAVALAQQETTIEGVVHKGKKTFPGAMIVLVPPSGLPLRSFLRRDQSDSDGSFSLRGVAPGQYTLVAIENGWFLDWNHPDFLARYLPGGISVTVKESSGKLIRLPDPLSVQPK